MKPKPIIRKVEEFFARAEQPAVQSFLTDVRARLSLSARHEELMLQDHLHALRYYRNHGLALAEATQRLAPSQLGDFYLVERNEWYPLDHAAKVYPLSMSLKRMMVFRVSGYLKKTVVPEILQMALTYVMRRFPYFATTLKYGVFWHYLDSAMRRFSVRPETKLPCAAMSVGSRTSPSLRVVYYRNRVSVEFFHILTDGFGAIIFLRTLLREYLRLLGNDVPADRGVFNPAEPPGPAEWHDDFTIGDHSNGAHGFADKKAVQLRGLLPFEQPNRVLHFNLPVSELLAHARTKGVTMTTLLLGYLMLACKDSSVPQGKRKIQIQLPVNMRKFYPSQSLRNFSLYCSIRLHPSEITTLDDILPLINAQVKQGGSKEQLDQTMQLSRRLVKCLRFVPLMIKRPIAYFIYGMLSDGVFTTTFSNIGPISVPPEMARHLEKFDSVLGPPITNRACCSLCSFGDRAMLTVTKNTQLSLFEDSLYRRLCEDGFTLELEGSR